MEKSENIKAITDFLFIESGFEDLKKSEKKKKSREKSD